MYTLLQDYHNCVCVTVLDVDLLFLTSINLIGASLMQIETGKCVWSAFFQEIIIIYSMCNPVAKTVMYVL